MERAVELRAGEYRLVLTPERGGSIARFDWRGEPLLRSTCGPSILDTACFPLVPFSNRIAFGRFAFDGREVQLAPNFPGSDHEHTIHGFGWLVPWEVVSCTATTAVLRHSYPGGEWPWRYVAEQEFTLFPNGLRHSLSLRNLSDTPMPAGLGLHPYFPRTDRTIYRGLHRGEWQTAEDGLPIALVERDTPVDWWQGAPAASRYVDTVYSKRDGPLVIQWPDRALEVVMSPTSALSTTVVYTPQGADYLCVEPVTHATDAVNRDSAEDAMRTLAPAETLEVAVSYEARTLLVPV